MVEHYSRIDETLFADSAQHAFQFVTTARAKVSTGRLRILPLLGFNVPWIFGSKYANIENSARERGYFIANRLGLARIALVLVWCRFQSHSYPGHRMTQHNILAQTGDALHMGIGLQIRSSSFFSQ